MSSKRKLTPYELNQLYKWTPQADVSQIGDKPIEYVTGHTEFCGLDFLVTQDTLIPRIESEQIVTTALQFIEDKNLTHPTIADIGTGSGCLGVSLAYKLSKMRLPYTIYLSDISLKALKVADLNAQRLLHSPENIFFQESNLLESFPKIKFDIIIANLPYIPTKNIDNLDSSVQDYEPKNALDGGPKGNLFINALLDKLPTFLHKNGIALFEIDDTHTIDSFTLPKSLKTTITNDCFNKPRFLSVSYNY